MVKENVQTRHIKKESTRVLIKYLQVQYVYLSIYCLAPGELTYYKDTVILQQMPLPVTTPGGRLNKKDGLTRYGDSHVKDKA